MSHYQSWSPVAAVYNPIAIGSIDGTDTEPHDRGIVRACNAKYKPNREVSGDPECMVFVARLNHSTEETTVRKVFSKYGPIKSARLVRDIVTGFSKGYAFVEYFDSTCAKRAFSDAHKMVIDDKEILVDRVFARVMEGWVPRRLGGGFGGRKESGQLRFGCRDRPFRKPIFVPSQSTNWSIDEIGSSEHQSTADRVDVSGGSRHHRHEGSGERDYRGHRGNRETLRRSDYESSSSQTGRRSRRTPEGRRSVERSRVRIKDEHSDHRRSSSHHTDAPSVKQEMAEVKAEPTEYAAPVDSAQQRSGGYKRTDKAHVMSRSRSRSISRD